jgi:adenylate cyclase
VVCGTQLEGWQGTVARLTGIKRSNRNPNVCSRCETHIEGGITSEMTVLFADLSSFTELTQELGAERMYEVVDAFLKMSTETLVRHGAYIDRYLGDAVMAFFNVPIKRDDHTEQAVAAAVEIQQGLVQLEQGFGRRFTASIGVASGYARVGKLGSNNREDFTAIGDVVNMASRLESQAQPGEIIVHSKVYEKVAEHFPHVSEEGLTLKGFEGQIPAYRLNATSISAHVPTSSWREPAAGASVGSVVLAILGAPCAAGAMVGPLAVALGAGAAFASLGPLLKFFDQDWIRFPLMGLATLATLANLYVLWQGWNIRRKKSATRAMTRLEWQRAIMVLALAVITGGSVIGELVNHMP